MKTLILFNRAWTFSTELPDVAKHLRGGEDVVWVALSPWAMATLEVHKIPYTIPDDYVDQAWAADLQSLGLSLYRRVLSILRKGVGERLYPELDGGLWEQDWWDLRFLHDGMVIRLAEMKAVIEALQPHRVLYIGEQHPKKAGFAPNTIDYYHSILEMLTGRQGIQYSREFKTVSVEGIGWRARGAQIKRRLLARLTQGLDRMKSAAGAIETDCAILALDRWYNWGPVLPVLQERGLRVVDWATPDKNETEDGPFTTEQVSQLLEATREAWEDIQFRGIPLFPLLKEPLVRYISDRYPFQAAIYRKAREILACHRIQAVTASYIHTLDTATIKWAAQQAGVSVLCWYHGGYSGYVRQENLPFLDGDADCFLTFGPGAADYASSVGCRAEPVVVGTTMFHRPITSRSVALPFLSKVRSRRVLLLTLTDFAGHHRFLVPSTRSDVRMWRNNLRILDVLSRHRDRYFLLIKRHPDVASLPPLDAAMHGLFQPEDYEVVFNEAKFGDLLPLVGGVIHLVPSTTLMESILGSIPVACYITPNTLTPEALTVLRKRVLAEEDLALFSQKLNAHLASGAPFADPTNTEFRETYAQVVSAETAADRIGPILHRTSVLPVVGAVR